MRRGLAAFLRNLADRIHLDDHHSHVEIQDEYGICRCRVDLTTDSHHGIDAEFEELPLGWVLRCTEDS